MLVEELAELLLEVRRGAVDERRRLGDPWPPYFALTGCSTSPITLATCLGVSFSPLSSGLRKSGMDLRSVRSFTALPARLDLNLNFSRNSSFHAPLFLRGGCDDFGFSLPPRPLPTPPLGANAPGLRPVLTSFVIADPQSRSPPAEWCANFPDTKSLHARQHGNSRSGGGG